MRRVGEEGGMRSLEEGETSSPFRNLRSKASVSPAATLYACKESVKGAYSPTHPPTHRT